MKKKILLAELSIQNLAWNTFKPHAANFATAATVTFKCPVPCESETSQCREKTELSAPCCSTSTSTLVLAWNRIGHLLWLSDCHSLIFPLNSLGTITSCRTLCKNLFMTIKPLKLTHNDPKIECGTVDTSQPQGTFYWWRSRSIH